TEKEWLACTYPSPMLYFLKGKASDRKFRLFAAACCRGIWHLLANDAARAVVEAAERFADGLAGDAEIRAANEASRSRAWKPENPQRLSNSLAHAVCFLACESDAAYAARTNQPVPNWPKQGYKAANGAWSFAAYGAPPPERRLETQSALLRDLFGPLPF